MEVGEQLAWLGVALRPSPRDNGVVLCAPYWHRITAPVGETLWTEFTIKYNVEVCGTENQYANGQCWHNLFANPVIARDFPIPRRRKESTGLEISLDMLVALGRTRYIDTFKERTFIKGYSTMLIPVEQSGDLLIWHLLYNKSPNQRISYLDCTVEHADIKLTSLGQFRHILGWCSQAVSVVGTTLATYNVNKSRLPNVHSTYTLEKAEISGGQFVTGTAVFAFGNTQKPVHISRYGYLTKLQWISSKYFVFWDEKEKRGWLVNGASALLHILRASLEHSKRRFRSAWLLDPTILGDATDPSGYDSALEVLINEDNRDLKLYVDKTELYEEAYEGQISSARLRKQTRYYRLEDRIEHVYNILEKLIDYQTDSERQAGLQVKVRPRRRLEGWDFRDLIADGDPFFARVATLQTIGKGWIDFTRAIHAVTLFGRGFGELIRPRSTTAIPCPRWSLLPTRKYYLAASMFDLQNIMDDDGDLTSNPRRLCHNIIWHMKQATFDPYPCTRGLAHKHHAPVQALFPLTFTKNLKQKPQVELQSRGAVIFGHNMNIHWHWQDDGDPVKGDPPPNPEAEEAVYDSGLGSSLSSSSNRSPSDLSDTTLTASDTISPSAPPSSSKGPREAMLKTSKRKRPLRSMISSISKRAKF